MAKKIVFDLLWLDDGLYLDSQEIYRYVGEETDKERELAYYIDQWCKYLNYYVSGEHNKEMAFGDTELARLEGWLSGYNFAKKIKVYTNSYGAVEIKMRGYHIVLPKPFII